MIPNAAAVDNINNVLNSQTTAKSKTDKSQAALSANLNDFLKLLTTQLKNQDPTNPLDTNQFTQQIAQLSSVEQQINTNSNLQQLIDLYSATQISGAVNYIGKRVEADGNKGTLANGQALFVYNLNADAASVDVSISDPAGNVVFNGSGSKQSGRNQVFWDGKNSFTGQQLPDGVYTITVTAKDGAGKGVGSTTSSSGHVTAVDLQNGKPTLMLGDYGVPLEKVIKIGEDPLGV